MKRVRERESDVGEVLRGNLLVSEECSKAPGWERSQNRGPRVGPYSRGNPKIGGPRSRDSRIRRQNKGPKFGTTTMKAFLK